MAGKGRGNHNSQTSAAWLKRDKIVEEVSSGKVTLNELWELKRKVLCNRYGAKSRTTVVEVLKKLMAKSSA